MCDAYLRVARPIATLLGVGERGETAEKEDIFRVLHLD